MRRSLWIGGLFILGWVLLCSQFPFFWDNILNSKLAHWYLETGFSQLVPPESMDAGHPPFFNIYIAGWWAILGKSLLVAHLAMLPFLFGILWQWQKFCRDYLSPQYANWGILILILQPTVIAQSSMVSPDVGLIFFFLMALNAEREKKGLLLILATIGMSLVTFRGILMVPSVFLVGFVLRKGWKEWGDSFKRVLWYLPVAAIVLGWLLYHWKVQGWLLSPPAETYGAHREMVGIGGLLRNLGILGWRLLDYGMVFVWLFALIAILFRYKHLKVDSRFRDLFLIFLLPTAWLTLLFIPFSNPIGHRYFAAHSLLLCLLALRAIELVETRWRRWAVPVVLGIGLLGGHFWVYPDKIAQGWDASLAHWSYFYLEKQSPFTNPEGQTGLTCSDFPLLGSSKFRYVTESPAEDRFKSISEVPWENCGCVIWSNISNGYSDDQLEELKDGSVWNEIQGSELLNVGLRVYQRVAD